MTKQNCTACKYLKNSKDGLCLIENASDGLPVRCVGPWSKIKHYYLERYINTFTTSMRNKWEGKLFYIDLFAGPGKCRVRKNEEEIDGSPLIALNTRYPFTKCFFVELNEVAIQALKKRCTSDTGIFINSDCNNIIEDIVNELPSSSLSLAFIDPTGISIKYNALENLVKDRRIDLIVTFPDSMAISRNFEKFKKTGHCKLDDFIGDDRWRELTKPEEVSEYYKKKLHSLGYREIKSGDEIPIRSRKRNLPLYSLLFASKHPLGQKFWNEIIQVEPSGQRRLFD